MTSEGPFVGLDWGITRVRAFLFDEHGAVTDTRVVRSGVAHVAIGGYPDVLRTLTEGWPSLPVLAGGMVGSRNGWQEAPYVECPAGPQELAGCLHIFEPGVGGVRMGIVPGVTTTDAWGIPDVMRGEEVQVLGSLTADVARDLVVLPGTHSKWVDVAAGRIQSFRTHMTGEVFGLLREQSILRLSTDGSGDTDEWFKFGVLRSHRGRGLLHHAFAARSLFLKDQVSPQHSGSYLSGLLIGEEITSEITLDPTIKDGEIQIVAEERLGKLYRFALEILGIRSRAVRGSTQRGLRKLFGLCALQLRG